MKKAITILLALLLCGAMILPALAESETVAIRLSEESLLIGTGVRVRLEVQTESTAKLKYTWETSDKKIASVANGNVTGEGEGEATVTCSALLNNEVVATASCAVSVYTSIRSLKAGADTTTLSVGQPVQVTAAITPENATYPQLVWTSSDESIATVDQNGVVTGLQPGRVKITCTSDQPNQAKAVSSGVQFTVKQQVTEIVLGKTQLVLWVKKSVEDGPEAETLRAEVLPENADSKKLIWESSDTAVAKVSNGKVSSVKSGVCTVTAKAGTAPGRRPPVTWWCWSPPASGSAGSCRRTRRSSARRIRRRLPKS